VGPQLNNGRNNTPLTLDYSHAVLDNAMVSTGVYQRNPVTLEKGDNVVCTVTLTILDDLVANVCVQSNRPIAATDPLTSSPGLKRRRKLYAASWTE
jgi:hypothetical protein